MEVDSGVAVAFFPQNDLIECVARAMMFRARRGWTVL